MHKNIANKTLKAKINKLVKTKRKYTSNKQQAKRSKEKKKQNENREQIVSKTQYTKIPKHFCIQKHRTCDIPFQSHFFIKKFVYGVALKAV